MAVLVSLIVFGQIARSGGMLRVLLRSDAEKLKRWLYQESTLINEAEDASRFIDVVKATLMKSPDHARYMQIHRLLRMVVEVGDRQDGKEFGQLLENANQLAMVDVGNLLTSLSAAVVVDRINARTAGASADPLARFKAIQLMVEKTGGAQFARTYQGEEIRLWNEALVQFVERPDTRLSLAIHMSDEASSVTADQYRGLLETTECLRGLARELRAGNHSAEAKTCERWIAQCAMGILETDVDAVRQLLCARLLLDVVEKGTPAAASLQMLIDDYHRHAASAPTDLTDQSLFKSQNPALFPSAFRRAFDSLMMALLFAATATGCAIMFIVTGIMAVVARVRRRDQSNSLIERQPAWYLRCILLLAPTVVASIFIVMRLSQHGLFSQSWLIAEFFASVTFGMAACTIIAGLHLRTTAQATRRVLFACLLTTLPLLGLILPPSSVAWVCRYFNLSLGMPLVFVTAMLAIVVAGIILSPARLRSIAATALLAWLMNIAGAIVILEIHRGLDQRHQALVVAHRIDEMSARLGTDWKEKYLVPVKKSSVLAKP